MIQATTNSGLDPTLTPIGESAGEAKPADAQAVAMGIGIGSEAPRARVSSTWVLLAGAVLVAGGVLWGMRWVGMKGGMTGGKAVTFDASLLDAASRPKRDHSGVLDDLKSSRVTQQVPGDSVKKNPFRIADSMAGLLPTVDSPQGDDGTARANAAAEAERRKAQERLRAVQSALAGLKVQSILGGRSPVARVSGKMVRIGDELAEFFTVKAIHGRSIELECDGRTFEVAMTAADGE